MKLFKLFLRCLALASVLCLVPVAQADYTGTITVTATAGCNWTVSVDVSWITVTNGATGTGNGTVTYLVANNPTSLSRTGRITVAGQVCIVTQAGIACTFTISPVGASFTYTGGSGAIAITASDSICSWTASSNVPWITFSPASGTGNGTIAYSVSPTLLSLTRTGALSIGGQTFIVTQTGDTTAPTVALTAPTNGGTISNIVTLSATATDNSTVARVEFYHDSATLIGTVLASPYNLPFQTTNIANGAHTFYASGFDPANNQGFSGTNTVTISNSSAINTNVWAQRFGGTSSDFGSSVAIDVSGNIILSGGFNNTIFVGTNMFTSAGARDILLAKFGSDGALLWAKSFGSTGDELIRGLVLDLGGNIYLCGTFTGLGNFGGGSTTSAGSSDMFIAKYSSAGSFVWSRVIGGAGQDVIYSIALNVAQTHLLATGSFAGTVVFNSTNTFTSFLNAADTFLAKYSIVDGSPVWAKTFVNGDVDIGISVLTDSGDNIILTGLFGSTIDLGLGSLSVAGTKFLYDLYIAKFASSGLSAPGTPLWAFRYGGANADTPVCASLNSSDDLFIGGMFHLSTDLGTGQINGTALNLSDNDMFIAKYSGSTGLPIWTRGIFCGTSGSPKSMSVDSSGNPILLGFFNTTMNTGAQTLTSLGSQDIFAIKFANGTPGTPLWAKSFGGTGADEGDAIATGADDYSAITGYFQGTANFSGNNLTSAGSVDIFLSRIPP